MDHRRLSSILLLFTVLIWASTYVVTKQVLHEAGPFTVTALRFVTGFAALFWPAWRQGFRLRQIFAPAMLKYSLTGIVLFYSLQNLGLTFTTAGNAALISAALPAAAALLSVWVLRERLSGYRLAGLALSIVGVVLVSGATPAGGGLLAMAGNALVAGSIFSWAVYTIQGKRLNWDQPALVVTAASMGAGLLTLVPLAVAEMGYQGLPGLSLPSWLALLYLGCGASALTLLMWNYAIRHVDAMVAAVYPNLIPIIGLLFAWAAGEPISALQLVGGSLAMVGVWLTERHLPA